MTSRMISVGDCYGMSDAMLIKSVLGAHGIEAIIPGLSSGTGAYTSGFASQILVPDDVAEEASALIAEARSGASASLHDDDDEDAEETSLQDAHVDELQVMTEQRRWRTLTMLIAILVPLGTGHLLNRAYGRGFMLAAVQVLAVCYLFAGHKFGFAMLIAGMVVDLVGAVRLANRRSSPRVRAALPGARVHKPS